MATDVGKRDYYEVLGVPRDADLTTIKKAYRKIAFECHPDRNPGNKEAEERFKEASEAYEVLSNPEKREIYDRFGHDGLRGRGYSGFTDVSDIFSSFSDIFEEFFGIGTRRTRTGPVAGADLRYDLEITLEEAALGTKKEISFERYAVCRTCNGSKSRPGSGPKTCPRCKGTGQVGISRGFFSIRSTCDQCGGVGQVITDPCETCKGRGKVPEKRNVTVKIPAGVDSGASLRLTGEGEAGERGGPYGNLYVVVHVQPHPFFERHGDDLFCRIPISFPQAALGAQIEVPTLEGNYKLEIPAGTQPGELFHIRNKGMPRLRGFGKGDLVVQVDVKVPTSLTPRQRELLEELQRTSEGTESSGGEDLSKNNKKKRRWR